MRREEIIGKKCKTLRLNVVVQTIILIGEGANLIDDGILSDKGGNSVWTIKDG